MTVKILRLRDVLDVVGVRKSTLYSWIKDGQFVAPVRLGPRAVGWKSDQVQAFVDGCQSTRSTDRVEAA
ncbi:AlpA family transcriptional regulator [Burkholderia ubonensis]|uniref:helix-turn-helix transcriptional regulator n=1 Tax=Burkholderia ubonensis TaxID=101571 RepID=UPI0008FE8618|nr:AlpA family phage regulatory protein [Burkholderia ubonensis]OJB36087.1 AlpA family transcriptional regulator [Burkholderia ubonensis]